MLQLGPGQNLLTMEGALLLQSWQSQSRSWHRQAIDHCAGCENWELLHVTNDLWWEEREDHGGAGIIIVIVTIIVTFIRAENADKLQHIPTHPGHQSSFPHQYSREQATLLPSNELTPSTEATVQADYRPNQAPIQGLKC